jgi:hypothetical protein
MKLNNTYFLALVLLTSSTGLIKATASMNLITLSPEVQSVCQKVKTVFSNVDNKYSWQCFAGALFHYIGLKKAAQNDGTQTLLKSDPRFAELQAALAETAKATNLLFIANRLESFAPIILSSMTVEQLADIITKRIGFNKNDPMENGKLKCDYKKIIKDIETTTPAQAPAEAKAS